MKKSTQLLALALVAILGISYFATTDAAARITGYIYGDALVIGYPGTTVASISTAGAASFATLATTGKLVPAAKTLAELAAITPAAKGEVYSVSNGTFLLCVSSGTGRGAFASPISSTTTCS
jgi:hypothetical protein